MHVNKAQHKKERDTWFYV